MVDYPMPGSLRDVDPVAYWAKLAPMTEEQIERRVERMMDHHDRLFMRGAMDQKTYDSNTRDLNALLSPSGLGARSCATMTSANIMNHETTWQDPNDAHINAWRASQPYKARPFRFEDLNGRPEPESWGPCYPKSASAAVERWRATALGRPLTADETRAYGKAVHEWIGSLNAPKRQRYAVPQSDLHYSYSGKAHCAHLRAAFHAQAAADKRKWAMSRDIAKAYAACPKLGDRPKPAPHAAAALSNRNHGTDMQAGARASNRKRVLT